MTSHSQEEIWSLRLQRELLALSESGEDVKNIGILPPFITVKDQHLDIAKGHCTVSFAVTVEGVQSDGHVPHVRVDAQRVDKQLGESTEEVESNDDNTTKTEAETETKTETDTENTKTDDNSQDNAAAPTGDEDQKPAVDSQDNQEENSGATVDSADVDTNSSSTDASPVPAPVPAPIPATDKATKFNVEVVITLDASLNRSLSNVDAARSYPFYKPTAILTSGAEYFPPSTKIQNDDGIVIDCDWTPSLHLNDAAMNVALKVRESIKRGEPCLKTYNKNSKSKWVMGGSSGGGAGGGGADEFLSDVAADLNKGAHKVATFFSGLKDKATAVAAELDQAVETAHTNRRNRENNAAAAGAAAADITSDASISTTSTATTATATNTNKSLNPMKFRSKKKEKALAGTKKVVTANNIEIGDEIDLALDPWCKAIGMYPSKAIRRPDFVEAAMEAAGQNRKSNKVAGAGLSGAGSMFRSFTKSAKSLVEESFLLLTNELIIEISCSKFSVGSANVTFAIPASHLAKLKFRREESISLFFKQAPDDPIIYMCPSSADAVKQIQSILKKHGVKGKHTNAAMQKTIHLAVQMIEDIKVMEQKLEVSPSREQVTIIMDLYRQAAEKFELAGDARHEEVMTHMRDFLAKSHVASILDGSYEKKEEAVAAVPALQEQEAREEDVTEQKQDVVQEEKKREPIVEKKEEKEVFEKKEEKEEDEVVEEKKQSSTRSLSTEQAEKEEEDFTKAMETAQDMINDAIGNLDDLDDLDDDLGILGGTGATGFTSSAGDLDVDLDVVSEFEDMLKDADKELQELMGE